MIKVPATPGGLAALEELAAAGRHAQRHADLLRAAVRRGPRRHAGRARSGGRRATRSSPSTASSSAGSTSTPRSTCPDLSPAAQGMVGIVNAKQIWQLNQQFWADKKLPLKQEMIFASTGTKKPDDPPWKYVEAFAGTDIETNPPATNEAVAGERADVHAAGRPAAAGRRCSTRSTQKVDMAEAGRDADGGGHGEVRRPAEGAAQADRGEAGGAEVTPTSPCTSSSDAQSDGSSANGKSLSAPGVCSPFSNRGPRRRRPAAGSAPGRSRSARWPQERLDPVTRP